MASHVISVYGPKGGVGKTLFATNFAHAVARKTRGRVLLVDLDPQDCGDIAVLLGIDASRTSVTASG